MTHDVQGNLSIIEINHSGSEYRIVWGLHQGEWPASELPTHLLNHAVKKKVTAEKMERYDVVVWAHHGVFCSGVDFDRALGLAQTVEKAAEILVKVMSMVKKKRQTITACHLRDMDRVFKLGLREEFLEEK